MLMGFLLEIKITIYFLFGWNTTTTSGVQSYLWKKKYINFFWLSCNVIVETQTYKVNSLDSQYFLLMECF